MGPCKDLELQRIFARGDKDAEGEQDKEAVLEINTGLDDRVSSWRSTREQV